MGVLAGSVLLASAGSFVGHLVVTFCYVYILLILLYVISSMLPLPYSIWLSRIQRFLYDVCEPYLRLFRRVLPSVGPLDLSPFVASLVLVVVASLVNNYV
jgi:YggT family protein